MNNQPHTTPPGEPMTPESTLPESLYKTAELFDLHPTLTIIEPQIMIAPTLLDTISVDWSLTQDNLHLDPTEQRQIAEIIMTTLKGEWVRQERPIEDAIDFTKQTENFEFTIRISPAAYQNIGAAA